MRTRYPIQLISPLFSYGADPHKPARGGSAEHPGTPEIRPASIRGQLRLWMCWLGCENHIDAIFGSTAGAKGHASRVIVRVEKPDNLTASSASNLPHKGWTKTCFPAGTPFTLHLIPRLGGLSPERAEVLDKSVEAWLMLGTLGGRGTRGAGSLELQDEKYSVADWKKRCAALLEHSHLKVWLGTTEFRSEVAARRMICDTLHESKFPNRGLGGANRRKTSPLRMRLARFSESDDFRIIFIWTERDSASLNEAIEILGQAKKPIAEEFFRAEVI